MNTDNDIKYLLQRFDNYLDGADSGYFDTDELFEIMQFYMVSDDIPKLKEAYFLAKRLHPKSADFNKLRALYELGLQHYEVGLELLADYDDYDEPGIVYLCLSAMLKCKRSKDAKKYALQVIDSQQVQENALISVFAAFIDNEDFRTGAQLAKKAIELFPDNMNIKFHYAQFSQAVGKLKVAEKYYLQIIDSDPFVGPVWLHLSEVYLINGKPDKALDAINYALAVNPHQSDWLLLKAKLLSTLGQYNESIQTMLIALQEGANEVEVYLLIGKNYLALHQLENVVEWLNKAKDKAPDNYEVLELLLNVYVMSGDQQKAYDVFKAMGDTDIPIENLMNCGAMLQTMFGDLKGAVQSYKKILRLQPDNIDVIIKIAFIEWDMDNYKEAKKYLLKAQKIDVLNGLVNPMLAAVYYALGQYNKMLPIVGDTSFLEMPTSAVFFTLCPELETNFKQIVDAIKNKEDFESLLVYPTSVADND